MRQKCCLLFSSADWYSPYWTNKQHTALEMARKDIRVLYIETVGLRKPKFNNCKDLKRIFNRIKHGIKGIKKVQDNIWVFSPIAIPFRQENLIIRLINQWILRLIIKSFINQHKFYKPMVWTYHPYMLDTLKYLKIGTIVYHCVDDLSEVPGVNKKFFKKEEIRLLKLSNIVFTTNMQLLTKCSAYNTNVHNYPNVVDIAHFKKAYSDSHIPQDLVAIHEPRIGYIGVLSDYKIDFQLLKDIAIRMRNWNFVLIGEEREGQKNKLLKELKCFPNVYSLGYRPYKALPEYLRGLNVALLPTLINKYTDSMFPMKYFEYLAAGVPVVATPLSFTKSYNHGMIIGSDANGFIKGIQKHLTRGRLTLAESTAYIGDNTWSTRLEKMLNVIEAYSK